MGKDKKMNQLLGTRNLVLGYGESIIIENLNLEIPKGEITVFVGGNGSGKSTLLRSLARLLKPTQGEILLSDKLINRYSTKEIAKELAILPQGPIALEGLTVLQLVKQGRYPYQHFFRQWSQEDENIVMSALEATGMKEFAERDVDSLSGGQRQRVWIAMTLAQQTDIILLDEPTTYLDLAHQVEVLDLLFELNEKENRTIVIVLHDLNLACRYAHNIVAIKDKNIYAQGKPEDIVTCQFVHSVFGMDCQILSDPIFGTPICIPNGRGRCILQNIGYSV